MNINIMILETTEPVRAYLNGISFTLIFHSLNAENKRNNITSESILDIVINSTTMIFVLKFPQYNIENMTKCHKIPKHTMSGLIRNQK